MRPATPTLLRLLFASIVLSLFLLPVACQDLGTSETSTTAETTVSSEITTTTDAQAYMPQLVGMTESEAEAELEALNVEYEVKAWPTSNSSKFGKVTEQDVAEGTEITAETTVQIKVGREGVEVPGLGGIPDYDARGWVESLGLEISINYDPPRDPAMPALYVVTSQSPSSGTYVLLGGTVSVTCSPEPEP